jgi:hypothetical protein
MDKIIRRLIFCLAILGSWQVLLGQNLLSIYENNSLVSFEKNIYSSDSIFHSSIRPYSIAEMKMAFDYDSVWRGFRRQASGNRQEEGIGHPASGIRRQAEGRGFRRQASGKRQEEGIGQEASGDGRKESGLRSVREIIFNRNMVVVNKKDYGVFIDPLFDFSYTRDFRNDYQGWNNIRGILVQGYIGKQVSFSTAYYENQSKPPLWLLEYVRRRNTMPGQGGVKSFGKDAFDYGYATGYVSWKPSKYFNFRLGHGKNFLGDGYRSLILSDFSSDYPYLSFTAGVRKIKYMVLYSQYSHPDVTDHTNNDGSSVFAKKFSTMHYLSIAPGKKLNISLFESLVWQSRDSSFNRGFELSYLNPVIFLRPVEFNLGSFDNELMGMNLRYTIMKNVVLYGQYVIDDMRIKEFLKGTGHFGNKYAYQAGMKTYDLFGIQNLNLQAEYNLVRPYTYSHRSTVQNYSNAREPLAHPSGANIKEAVAIAKYSYKRLYFNLKYVWSATGLDSAGLNYGKNIFLGYKSYPYEYGNKTTQGLFTKLNQVDGSISYLVNPSTNANLFVETTYRRETNVTMNKSYLQFGFGFRTSLRNLYYDFF